MPRPDFSADDDAIFPFDDGANFDDEQMESLLHPTFDEVDDETLLEFDDEYWDALLPDDDYEALPDERDFWTDQEAA